MEKKLIILASLVIVLLISSCGKGPRTQNIEEEYRTGTQGLVMNFVKNAPPNEVYDGDDINIMVELRNKGAYPTTRDFEGKLEITGFDEAALYNGRWDGSNLIPPTLEGRSQDNPEGGYEMKTYRAIARVPFGNEIYEPTIIVHACYRYQTIASPTVCIDPDPYSIVQEEKPCRIHDVSLGGGQGAPVAVTRVEERVSKDKVHFKIYIKNVGGGTVLDDIAYSYSYYSRCPLDLDYEDLNKVIADVSLSYSNPIECSPQGTVNDPIRLNENGEGFIRCSFPKPNSASAFETPLQIKLYYAYADSISKKIKIINLK